MLEKPSTSNPIALMESVNKIIDIIHELSKNQCQTMDSVEETKLEFKNKAEQSELTVIKHGQNNIENEVKSLRDLIETINEEINDLRHNINTLSLITRNKR